MVAFRSSSEHVIPLSLPWQRAPHAQPSKRLLSSAFWAPSLSSAVQGLAEELKEALVDLQEAARQGRDSQGLSLSLSFLMPFRGGPIIFV